MGNLTETLEKINSKISEQNTKTPKSIYTVNCLICNKEFIYIPRYEMMKETICSLECYKQNQNKLGQIFYQQHIRIIPEKYRDIRFEDKELMKKSLKKSLFITGKSGTGKTTFMAELVKQYFFNQLEVKWINYSAFIMKLQNSFKQDDESPFKIAEETATFGGILAIDDIGAEKITDFVKQITYYIINEREQRMLPLLITSNFSLKEIDEMIDSRISSRIAGICEVIKFSGEDKRLKNQSKFFNTDDIRLTKGTIISPFSRRP